MGELWLIARIERFCRKGLIMEKDITRLSIIVAAYNAELTIRKCVDSILNQDFSNFELIIVNDGSTDNTFEICREYAECDARVKVISQENRGLIAARKAGVEVAAAAVIGFVDSDDWIDSSMYQELMDIYNKYDCQLVSSGVFREFEDDGYTEEYVDNYAEGLYSNMCEQIYPNMLWNEECSDYGLYCTLVNKIYKKSILLDVYNNIDTRVFYGEDCLTIYSYIMRIKAVYILKKSYYHYIIKKNSMCRSADERLLSNTYYLYKGLEKAFTGYGELSYVLLRQLRRYILNVESHSLRMLYGINMQSMGTWQFDYPELAGKDVLLYGAGGAGIPLYRYLTTICGCNVIAWLDKSPAGKERECLHDIGNADDIVNYKYDYIVIGVESDNLAKSIKFSICEKYGINPEKIVWRKPAHTSVYAGV